MAEFVGDYIVCNGLIKPAGEFGKWFGSPAKYIYEVFRVQEGIPVFIEDHLDRLWKTAGLENISLPFTREVLHNDILDLIQANSGRNGNVKIFINFPADSLAFRLVYFNPHQYPTPEQFLNGVRLSLFFATRNNPNAKVMDVLLRSNTDNFKAENDVYEVLLVDHNGNITEGSRSNVFFIINEQLITPPVHTVLEGVTRKHILQICAEKQIPFIERTFHVNELAEANAVFISGTSRRVLPASKIDDHTYDPNHPLLRKLQHLLELKVNEYLCSKAALAK